MLHQIYKRSGALHWDLAMRAVRCAFFDRFALKDAIGSRACSLEASMRVSSDIPLHRLLPLTLSILFKHERYTVGTIPLFVCGFYASTVLTGMALLGSAFFYLVEWMSAKPGSDGEGNEDLLSEEERVEAGRAGPPAIDEGGNSWDRFVGGVTDKAATIVATAAVNQVKKDVSATLNSYSGGGGAGSAAPAAASSSPTRKSGGSSSADPGNPFASTSSAQAPIETANPFANPFTGSVPPAATDSEGNPFLK
jgi:hypothetical protein